MSWSNFIYSYIDAYKLIIIIMDFPHFISNKNSNNDAIFFVLWFLNVGSSFILK